MWRFRSTPAGVRLNSVEVGHIANVSGAAAEESDIHCGKRSARLRFKRCKREKTLLLSWGRFNLIKEKNGDFFLL